MFALVWHVGILFLYFSVKCTSKQFKCLDGKKCIDHSHTCDGYHDCDDDSDELSGFCAGKGRLFNLQINTRRLLLVYE